MDQKTKRNSILVATILLLIVVLAISGFYFLGASRYIALDINPSLEIQTNRLGYVVHIEPLNPDAKTLLAGYRANRKQLNHVVEDLVDRMVLQGYLGEERPNEILVTVKDGRTSQATLDQMNQSLSAYLESRSVNANVYTQTAGWNKATQQSAKLAGVSPGKMNLMEQVELNANLTQQELAEMSVGELVHYAAEHDIVLDSLKQPVTAPAPVVEEEPVADKDVPAEGEAQQAAETADTFSQQDAIAVFQSYYPGVTPQTVELQDGGSKYYLYGEQDGIHYKMNVLTDGAVVYHSPTVTTEQNTPAEQPSSSAQEEVPATSTGGAIDEAGAIAIFQEYFPGITPSKVELQDGGSKYYLYGEQGGTHYKMNVLTDGTVVYHNAGGGGSSGGNQSSSQSAQSSQDQSQTQTTSGALSAEDAKAIFVNTFSISPQTVELQDGDSAYYMYAESGGTHYKMKIRVSDGSILFSNTSGGGNRGGRGGNYGGRGGRR